jgi:hypothetical protein
MESTKVETTEKPTLNKADVSRSIFSVCKGWGEACTYYKVGGFYIRDVKIAKIEQQTKTIGAGYYNDLTINMYVGSDADGKILFEMNEGLTWRWDIAANGWCYEQCRIRNHKTIEL